MNTAAFQRDTARQAGGGDPTHQVFGYKYDNKPKTIFNMLNNHNAKKKRNEYNGQARKMKSYFKPHKYISKMS